MGKHYTSFRKKTRLPLFLLVQSLDGFQFILILIFLIFVSITKSISSSPSSHLSLYHFIIIQEKAVEEANREKRKPPLFNEMSTITARKWTALGSENRKVSVI